MSDDGVEELIHVYQPYARVCFAGFCLIINNLNSPPYHSFTPQDIREIVRMLQQMGISTEIYFNKSPGEIKIIKDYLLTPAG